MSDQQLSFTCLSEQAGRLDKFLVICLPEFSRARLQGLIRDGMIRVDGKTAGKSGLLVEAGARVDVLIPTVQPSDLTAEAIPLDIVFENNDLMVVNKPAGMVVHPAAGHAGGTLMNAALAHAPDLEGISGEQRPGLVHRLDKETSGLILLAKNDHAFHWLQEQFRQRKVVKSYLALVYGHPPTPTGRIEASIGRDPSHRKKMAITTESKGRDAVSEYLTLETFPAYTLLEVHPLTGRTHQIRVHMAFLGCPIVGDSIYGRRKSSLPISRHFLHAQRLTIVLPGESVARTFEAPLPIELARLLSDFRRG